jgi:hypothetical protein
MAYCITGGVADHGVDAAGEQVAHGGVGGVVQRQLQPLIFRSSGMNEKPVIVPTFLPSRSLSLLQLFYRSG